MSSAIDSSFHSTAAANSLSYTRRLPAPPPPPPTESQRKRSVAVAIRTARPPPPPPSSSSSSSLSSSSLSLSSVALRSTVFVPSGVLLPSRDASTAVATPSTSSSSSINTSTLYERRDHRSFSGDWINSPLLDSFASFHCALSSVTLLDDAALISSQNFKSRYEHEGSCSLPCWSQDHDHDHSSQATTPSSSSQDHDHDHSSQATTPSSSSSVMSEGDTKSPRVGGEGAGGGGAGSPMASCSSFSSSTASTVSVLSSLTLDDWDLIKTRSLSTDFASPVPIMDSFMPFLFPMDTDHHSHSHPQPQQHQQQHHFASVDHQHHQHRHVALGVASPHHHHHHQGQILTSFVDHHPLPPAAGPTAPAQWMSPMAATTTTSPRFLVGGSSLHGEGGGGGSSSHVVHHGAGSSTGLDASNDHDALPHRLFQPPQPSSHSHSQQLHQHQQQFQQPVGFYPPLTANKSPEATKFQAALAEAAAATALAVPPADIQLLTKLNSCYWKNGRKNLQCFPICPEHNDFYSMKMSNRKHTSVGVCRGPVYTHVFLPAAPGATASSSSSSSRSSSSRSSSSVPGATRPSVGQHMKYEFGVGASGSGGSAYEIFVLGKFERVPQRNENEELEDLLPPPAQFLSSAAFEAFRYSCFQAVEMEERRLTTKSSQEIAGLPDHIVRSTWFFLPDVWKVQPMLKKKRKATRSAPAQAFPFCFRVFVYIRNPVPPPGNGEQEISYRCIASAASSFFELYSTRTVDRVKRKYWGRDSEDGDSEGGGGGGGAACDPNAMATTPSSTHVAKRVSRGM